jgi:hypothetical protein
VAARSRVASISISFFQQSNRIIKGNFSKYSTFELVVN